MTFLNELYLQMCLDRQVPVKVTWTWKIEPDPNKTYIEIGNLFPILENTKNFKPLR